MRLRLFVPGWLVVIAASCAFAQISSAASPVAGAPRKIGSTFARTAPRPQRPGASAAGRGASPASRTPKGAAGTQRAFKAAQPAALPPSAVAAAAESSYGWTAPSGGTILGPADSAYSRKSEALSAKAAALLAPIADLAALGDERGGPLGASEESAKGLGRLVWAITAGDGMGRAGGMGRPVVRDLASLEPLSPAGERPATGLAPAAISFEPGTGRAQAPLPAPRSMAGVLSRSGPPAGAVQLVVLKVAGQSLIFSSVAAEPARRLALAAVLSAARPAPGREAPRAFAGLPMPAGAALRDAAEPRRDAGVSAVSVSEHAVRGESELYRFHAVSPAASVPSAGAMSPARAVSPLRAAAVAISADWNAASAGGLSSAAAPALLLSGLFSCLVLAAASLREFVG